MKNLFKNKIVFSILALFLSSYTYALTLCPIQGLDKKVCPIVVDFFDEIAKHDSEFAKHWQNHHWITQAGDNYKPSIEAEVHKLYSFTERRSRQGLYEYVEGILKSAATKDSSFQQVLDSHNFFVMTVQAMHISLQRGADRFNTSGTPMLSLHNGKPEEVDIKLTYVYDIQVPTNDRYLNAHGIYSTTHHRYIHSTYIDSTSYTAGAKVNPVIVSTTTAPQTSKVIISTQNKNLQGVISPVSPTSSSTSTSSKQASTSGTTINKKPPQVTSKARTATSNTQNQVPPAPTPVNTNIAPPIAYQYNVPKPLKTSGKIGTSNKNVPLGSKVMISVHNKANASSPKIILYKPVNTNFNSNLPKNIVTSTMPKTIVLQEAKRGINKTNINTLLITHEAGDQLKNNSRHYVVDENSKVWSCKVSSLGFRASPNINEEANSFGHVETVHIKATQFSHIPSNHSLGSACLISISK